MHKIFGEKLKTNYYERPGAYLVPINAGKIAVVKTQKGFFFLGGGFEKEESAQECIARECREEIGYEVTVGEKVCSAEHYTYHKKVGYFHPVQEYYLGKLVSKTGAPVEPDHTLMWLTYDELKGRMFSEMQNWALEVCYKKYKE